MDKFKRKLKEVEAQGAPSLLKKLKSWKDLWRNRSLTGTGVVINITVLGEKDGFEAYIDGESFDKHIRPAIQNAMEDTLLIKRHF